jgi:sugar phosphate isomerase/epimerase
MLPQIALQLYTLRNALAQDFPGTLAHISQMGYRAVETAFLPEHISVSQAAIMIQDAGLQVIASHCELPEGDQVESVLEMMATYGSSYVVWHGWPEDPDYSSLDGIRRLADRYNAASELLRKHGYNFGLHNHWWEMTTVQGQIPHYLLRQLLDPSIFFEVDTYWTKTAGLDPARVVAELGPRAPLFHIKDGPTGPLSDMVAVGEGVMDFLAIARASGSNAKYWIVELDRCATDMMSAVAGSFSYLTEKGLAAPLQGITRS